MGFNKYTSIGYATVLVTLLTATAIGQEDDREARSAEPSDVVDPDSVPLTEELSDSVDEGWKGFHIGPLRIGGAIRFNYIYKDWDEAYQSAGEIAFDTARINLDLNADQFIGSFEYRYYRDKFSGGHEYNMLHHAWLGWRFDEQNEIQGGVTKVPFGILPYASHNWFFQLPYYVGLADDHDLGIKYIRQQGPWNLQFGYFITDEGNYVGISDDSARYSYDLVREGTNGNVERHQFNVRVAHTIQHAEMLSTELGLSLMAGTISNRNPLGGTGGRYAVAGHVNGNYERWNLMLQAIHYRYDVDNDPNLDASPNGDFVAMGAYDASYHVSSAATIFSVGPAYTIPVSWGWVRSFTFYNDFSLMMKSEDDFRDSVQNVTGVSIDANPFFIYIDVANGKNHPWLGGDWTDGLASGGADTGWNTRFNVNVGLYF